MFTKQTARHKLKMLPARESGQGCCLPDFSNKAKLSLKVVFIMFSENLDKHQLRHGFPEN